MTDNLEIQLQENIPLNDADIKHIKSQQNDLKKLPIILAFCVLVIWGFIAWYIRNQFAGFHYYDYLLFVGSGLAMYAFIYFITWLLEKYDNYNWKKDKLYGKSRLTSYVVERNKTEYAEYLTFAGEFK